MELPTVAPRCVKAAEAPSTLRRARTDLLVIAGVFVAVAWLGWYLRESPWPFDPMFYFENAGFISGEGGRPRLANEHRALRLGVVVPLAVAQKLFGYSDGAYYSYPIGMLGLFASVTYALARLVLPRLRAVWSVVLVGLVPFVTEWSSHPFPDMASGTWFGVGVFLLLAPSRWQLSRRWARAGSVGAGLALGVAWTSKETIIFLAPVVLLVLLVSKTEWRDAAVVVASALFVLVLEMALIWHWTGDAFARLDVLTGRPFKEHADLSNARLAKIERSDAGQGTLWRAAGVLPRWFFRQEVFGIPVLSVLLLGPLGALVAWRRGRALPWLVFAVWGFGFWLAYTAIGPVNQSGGGFILRILNIRYWIPIVPALCIGLVGGAGLVADAIERRTPVLRSSVVVALAGLGLLVAYWPLDPPSDAVRADGGHYEEFRGWLDDQGGRYDRIHAPFHTRRIVTMYTGDRFFGGGWDGTTTRLATPIRDSSLVVAGSESLLLGAGPGAGSASTFEQAGPGGEWFGLGAPPLDWDVAFVSDKARLVALDPHGTADDVLARSTEDPRQGIGGVELPGDLRNLRIRWEFVPEGNGPARAWCSYRAGDRIESVEAFTFNNLAWSGDEASSATSHLLDFFCPVPLSNPDTVRVTIKPRGALEAETVSVSVYAETGPGP